MNVLLYAIFGAIIGFIFKQLCKQCSGKIIIVFTMLGVLLYFTLKYKNVIGNIEPYDETGVKTKELYMSEKDEDKVCKPTGCN